MQNILQNKKTQTIQKQKTAGEIISFLKNTKLILLYSQKMNG